MYNVHVYVSIVTAEPVVTECTKKLGDDAVYIYCAVGGREL